MIGLRIFWALFLAGMVAHTFHRAWRWEHGEPLPDYMLLGDEPRTKETFVLLDAVALPWILLAILILFAMTDGMNGIARFLSLSLDVMLVISIYFLLLLLLLPVFRRYFSARACATMWILPAFLFWQIHILLQSVLVPVFVIYIPKHVLNTLFLVWGIGFALVFAGRIIEHMLFRRKVMSVAYPVHNSEVSQLFEQELQQLEYYFPVELVISPAVSAPLSMGTLKRNRVTVLPKREFSPQELQLIFRHEIHHLQRGDVGTKIFFAFCQALCWFNPLMWIATRKASDDLELSCDEIVLEDANEETRRQYAELLLSTAGQVGGFTTCLSAAAETMRYRLKHILTLRKRQTGTLLLSFTMVLCVMSYGTVAVSTDRGSIAELITAGSTATDITDVYYRSADSENFREITAYDGDSLFSYLTSLEVERFSSANEYYDIDGQGLSVQIMQSHLIDITIYDHMVQVFHFGSGGSIEYFYLRSDVDWERIESCLH